MKLSSALVCCAAVALASAAPAAAKVPYEASWKRAAKEARFVAVPAPSRLDGFTVLESGPGGTGGIKGAYRRVEIGLDDCPSFLDQSVSGYFQRSSDGGRLELTWFRKYPRTCPHPGGKRKLVRRIRVLGVRMRVWRVRFGFPTVATYEVSGTLRRRGFRLSGVGTSVDDTARIARSLRWVRR